MNPAALSIEALPAIVIFSAFVLVMVKIFIINGIPTKQERMEKRRQVAMEKQCTSKECTVESHH